MFLDAVKMLLVIKYFTSHKNVKYFITFLLARPSFHPGKKCEFDMFSKRKILYV